MGVDKTDEDIAIFQDKGMVNDDDILKIFVDMADNDGDQLIDLNELLTILELGDKKLDDREMFTKLMKAADTDGNGFISASELKNIMLKTKADEVEADDVDEGVKMIISIADANGDKRLSIEVAVNMFGGGP